MVSNQPKMNAAELEGDWRIERAGRLLPPMPGVWKRIRGRGGETCVGPLPAWPFRVERRGEHVALVYRPPFSASVDELRGRFRGPRLVWRLGRIVARKRGVSLCGGGGYEKLAEIAVGGQEGVENLAPTNRVDARVGENGESILAGASREARGTDG